MLALHLIKEVQTHFRLQKTQLCPTTPQISFGKLEGHPPPSLVIGGGVKLDIENVYFHLENSPRLKPYLRMMIAGRLFQLEGFFCGLSTMPYLWQKLMNTFFKKWRKLGYTVFIYLYDILRLHPSKEGLKRQLEVVLQDIQE